MDSETAAASAVLSLPALGDVEGAAEARAEGVRQALREDALTSLLGSFDLGVPLYVIKELTSKATRADAAIHGVLAAKTAELEEAKAGLDRMGRGDRGRSELLALQSRLEHDVALMGWSLATGRSTRGSGWAQSSVDATARPSKLKVALVVVVGGGGRGMAWHAGTWHGRPRCE